MMGCYEAEEMDEEGNVLPNFRQINPLDQLLFELMPLQAVLYLQVRDLLEMRHEYVHKKNLEQLFLSTAMHLIFLKKPETVQQNIIYCAENMLTEDKVQADNMLDRMLVQAYLWYPEFDKEADICGGMVGVVVMFNVKHQESNTITPEKCIVPVHLLTRGFNARHQYEAKSGAQQARTVLVEQLYCPKECTSLLTCNIVTS